MRFLVDAQLPIALARWVVAQGHSATHVYDLEMAGDDDSSIWRRAIREGEVVVSKDEDFAVRRIISTTGPQVVWVRVGNCSNRALLAWLAPLWLDVVARLAAGETLIEIV